MIKFLIPLLVIGATVFWWKLGAQSSAQALRKATKPLQNDQIDALLARLATTGGFERVELRLMPEPAINGLATDTGEIYITQGLFDTFRAGKVSARVLASVVAHELGHLALGHLKRRMIEVAGRQAAQLVLGGLMARFIPIFGGAITTWLLKHLTMSLSRRDEFEADAYATALMIRSGLGAEHQATMLEKIETLSPGAVQAGPAWLESHPPVSERAAAIRQNAARWQGHAPS